MDVVGTVLQLQMDLTIKDAQVMNIFIFRHFIPSVMLLFCNYHLFSEIWQSFIAIRSCKQLVRSYFSVKRNFMFVGCQDFYSLTKISDFGESDTKLKQKGNYQILILEKGHLLLGIALYYYRTDKKLGNQPILCCID